MELLNFLGVYAAIFKKFKFERFSTIISSSSVSSPFFPLVFPIPITHALICLVVSCRSQMLCLYIFYFFPFYSTEEVNSIDLPSSLLILSSVNANLLLSLSSRLFYVGCVCPFLAVGVIAAAGVLGSRAGPWH